MYRSFSLISHSPLLSLPLTLIYVCVFVQSFPDSVIDENMAAGLIYPLQDICRVSQKITVDIAEYVYAERIASRYPEPTDKDAIIRFNFTSPTARRVSLWTRVTNCCMTEWRTASLQISLPCTNRKPICSCRPYRSSVLFASNQTLTYKGHRVAFILFNVAFCDPSRLS